MSHQSSSSSWSKFFKQPGSNSGTKSPPHSANSNYNPYSDNPFHRPPSSTSTYVSNAASEATFRTGSASTASGSTLKGGLNSNHQINNKIHSTPPMSSHDLDADEGECPVCLEPLSFSFRLPGEKPHVVPECGHALHEVSSGEPASEPRGS
ncbi:hypothetical protein M408DRAFT_197410 [Serendipita vermifera MAFF 305830]|uniref:Uncharacterized protein n=1 Tax=Serendipita vermifera MAFF 305830 TaxID=933852 RepID=A0A0C3B409_SERVB|nr:hypothetical protein M408DRAFT_197410 [Serendipita vermifera MAFF 305830]